MAEEYTIGRLAKAVGLSRSTLLYYDRIGLLRATNRSGGNYRLYSADEAQRLRRICAYREMGLPLRQIRTLTQEGHGDSSAEAMLERHLASLEREIELLRKQQRQVVSLLEEIASRGRRRKTRRTKGRPNELTSSKAKPPGRREARPGVSASRSSVDPATPLKGRKRPKPKTVEEEDMISKDRWVDIMRAAGLSDDDMTNWHRQFERLEPAAHQEFLESLGIGPGEIQKIREHAKG